MASKMSPPPQLDHLALPKPERLPDGANQQWRKDAQTVASGLKPKIFYRVVKPDQDAVICVDQKIASNLKKNVRLVSWYRGEIERQIHELPDDKGAEALAGLIDHYFEILSDSLPRIKIRKTGRINRAQDHVIQFSHNKLWEILAIINRYFFYKSQIHNLPEQSVSANYLLIESMVKTAAIYGADPPYRALEEIKVELSNDYETGWKKSAKDALDALENEGNSADANAGQLCQIKIPAKPKKPAKPKPAKKGFPSDVEDIKEVSGRIFIKRNGRWTIWKD